MDRLGVVIGRCGVSVGHVNQSIGESGREVGERAESFGFGFTLRFGFIRPKEIDFFFLICFVDFVYETICTRC